MQSLSGVSNDTLITVTPSTLVMGIGQNVTLLISITVPPYSSSKILFDIDLPVDGSACMTVHDVRVIGTY